MIEITVTIKLTTSQAKLLSKWASVSRTFDWAEKIIDTSELEDEEDAYYCLEELKALHQPLDTLHQQVRSALWKANIG